MSVDAMIKRFSAIWGNPNTEDPKQFISEYRRCLNGFRTEVLELAADRAIEQSKFWPRPSEILEFATSAARNYSANASHALPYEPAEHKAIEQRPSIAPDERARVEALMSEFRKAMTAVDMKPILERRRPMDRDAFGAMQDASPNTQLHRDWRGRP